MTDYINREAFIVEREAFYCADCPNRKNSKGKFVFDIGETPCKFCGIRDVLDDAKGYPAADVVEVVRCKDCKHADYGVDEEGNRFLKCIGSGRCYGGTQPYFFCADGERKEQNDDLRRHH